MKKRLKPNIDEDIQENITIETLTIIQRSFLNLTRSLINYATCRAH